MARDDEEKAQEQEFAKLNKSIKTTRTLFISVLVAMVVIISISVTSAVVINLQLAGRDEVPAEDFAEDLDVLASQLEHISAIHNAEAQVYFEFQDTLAKIETLYRQEEINELRRLLVERETDHRKLLTLMAEGRAGLAAMLPGDRQWVAAYTSKLEAAKNASLQREKALKAAMAPKSEDPATPPAPAKP